MRGNLLGAVFKVVRVVIGQNSNINGKVKHQDGGNNTIPKAVCCPFLTLWRPWLGPTSFHVGFVMDRVTLRQVFSEYVGFSMSL